MTERREMKRFNLLVLLSVMILSACGQGPETGAGPDEEQASPTMATASPEAEGPGPECEETSEITTVDNEFDPSCIVSSDTSITVTNKDDTLHSFTISGTEADVDIQNLKTETIDVAGATGPEGETFFVCKYHPGMDGFLWIR